MSKRLIYFFILAAMFGGSKAFAAPFAPWVDFWEDTARSDTHFEKGFAQGRTPILLRSNLKIGITLPGSDPSTILMPYIAANGSISYDKNFWNNIYSTGYGIRIFPFINKKTDSTLMEWIPDTRLYAEKLTANYFKDRGSATAEATEDTRFGVEIWHEWNTWEPEKRKQIFNTGAPWTEIYSDISYRETNFADVSTDPFRAILAAIQIRSGLYVDSMGGSIIEPYGVTTLSLSGKNNFYLNYVSVGAGLRYHPFRYIDNLGGALKFFAKGRFYAEISGISYLKEKPPDGTPTSDFRTGFELAFGR